ncbi:MAG: hypothetical protein EOP84_01425 [Verrucomicrobiaceae bacterium]|nr:MAG: hypothetical protein EOP84_01425 [Verrucomicrobiaceae bacterium]
MTNRRDVFAEQQATKMMEDFANRDGLLPGGGFDRPVIVDYVSEYQRYVQATSEAYEGMKLSTGYLKQELASWAKHSPQRWEDTTQRFKDKMIYFSVKGHPEEWSDFTLWIGKKLIDQSISSKKPLAAILLKRLDEAVSEAFPEAQIGFFLTIERKAEDEMALHAHGVVVCSDASILMDPKKRKQLRDVMRKAATPGHHKCAARQLDMPWREADFGWWRYIFKQRRTALKQRAKHQSPPLLIGKRITARSHYVTQRTKDFYERARIVVRGVQTGSLAKWKPEQWDRVEP